VPKRSRKLIEALTGKVADQGSLQEVLTEIDPFRLTIRGHATIEKAMNEALADAFEGGLPGAIRSLPFRTTLSLLIALGVIDEPHAEVVRAVTRLRNDLAHGKIHDVSLERARTLVEPVKPLLKSQPTSLDTDPPPPVVVFIAGTIAYAHFSVSAGARAARERRDRSKKALELERQMRKLMADFEKEFLTPPVQ
jgi:hypothetical protein